LPSYGLTLGFDKDRAAYLLSIVSTFDLIGRITGCALSDINVIPKSWYFVGGLAVSGIALGLLPAFHSYLGISIFCGVFGLGTGCYVGITPVIFTDILGIDRLTSSYGISLFVAGVLQLIGPPICLAFYEYIGSYSILFIVLGCFLFFGAVLWCLMPYAKRRNDKK
jgi:MFS family permease